MAEAGPTRVVLTDPFRSRANVEWPAESTVAYDLCHYAALILQAIDEGTAPQIRERSPYDQVLLDVLGGYLAGRPSVRESALRMLLFANDVIVPNVDIHPGDLYSRHHAVQLGRSDLTFWSSPEFVPFLMRLESLVLRHPLASHVGLTAGRYRRLVQKAGRGESFWEPGPDREALRVPMLVSALIQEIRSVLLDAYAQGIPSVGEAFSRLPSAGSHRPANWQASDQSAYMVRIYFKSAIYSPAPRTTEEALDLRGHPRVERWRQAMRDWSTQLASGAITEKRIEGAIREANSYIEGAHFARQLVPEWAEYFMLPLEVLTLFAETALGMPLENLLLMPLLVVAAGALRMYGQVVYAQVTGPTPSHYGWYLVGGQRRRSRSR